MRSEGGCPRNRDFGCDTCHLSLVTWHWICNDLPLRHPPAPRSRRPQARDRRPRAPFGLDFYDTIFEVVEADDLNEIASYGGFPTRYPHWSFGMSYEELQEGLRVRPVEDLRDGHQQRPVLRLPDALQSHRRSEAGHGPRLRPLRFLQEQRLLRAHQPQDDGRNGQSRRPRPPLCREARRGRGRERSSTAACRSTTSSTSTRPPSNGARKSSRYDFKEADGGRRTS